jgi:hypothetical protein
MLVDLKVLQEPNLFGYHVHRYDRGLYNCKTFNAELLIWDSQPTEFMYPHFDVVDSYGVIDSPKQFQEMFGPTLEADPRPLVVAFSHIAKNVENKGQYDGWRWHKWGEYYGTGKPTCEYLDDEQDFCDGVYVFHIYHVAFLETLNLSDQWEDEPEYIDASAEDDVLSKIYKHLGKDTDDGKIAKLVFSLSSGIPKDSLSETDRTLLEQHGIVFND